jgi:DNA-binding response OmpR family regulator
VSKNERINYTFSVKLVFYTYFDILTVPKNNDKMNTHQKIKILIVDDNDQMRHIVRLTFARHEIYDILEATQGIQALDMIRDTSPDIVFLDIMMPGDINGIEVCQRIKSTQREQYCFVVLLSAKATQEDINIGLHAGADVYLIKPFSPLKLIDIVEKFNKKVAQTPPIAWSTFQDNSLQQIENTTINYELLLGFDPTRLDVLETMLGSQELVLKIIKSFVADLACVIEEIQHLLQKEDIEQAQRKLHTLKGSSADVGATDVAQIVKDIEEILFYQGDTYEKMLALSQAWRVIDSTVQTRLL